MWGCKCMQVNKFRREGGEKKEKVAVTGPPLREKVCERETTRAKERGREGGRGKAEKEPRARLCCVWKSVLVGVAAFIANLFFFFFFPSLFLLPPQPPCLPPSFNFASSQSQSLSRRSSPFAPRVQVMKPVWRPDGLLFLVSSRLPHLHSIASSLENAYQRYDCIPISFYSKSYFILLSLLFLLLSLLLL